MFHVPSHRCFLPPRLDRNGALEKREGMGDDLVNGWDTDAVLQLCPWHELCICKCTSIFLLIRIIAPQTGITT